MEAAGYDMLKIVPMLIARYMAEQTWDQGRDKKTVFIGVGYDGTFQRRLFDDGMTGFYLVFVQARKTVCVGVALGKDNGPSAMALIQNWAAQFDLLAAMHDQGPNKDMHIEFALVADGPVVLNIFEIGKSFTAIYWNVWRSLTKEDLVKSLDASEARRTLKDFIDNESALVEEHANVEKWAVKELASKLVTDCVYTNEVTQRNATMKATRLVDASKAAKLQLIHRKYKGHTGPVLWKFLVADDGPKDDGPKHYGDTLHTGLINSANEAAGHVTKAMCGGQARGDVCVYQRIKSEANVKGKKNIVRYFRQAFEIEFNKDGTVQSCDRLLGEHAKWWLVHAKTIFEIFYVVYGATDNLPRFAHELLVGLKLLTMTLGSLSHRISVSKYELENPDGTLDEIANLGRIHFVLHELLGIHKTPTCVMLGIDLPYNARAWYNKSGFGLGALSTTGIERGHPVMREALKNKTTGGASGQTRCNQVMRFFWKRQIRERSANSLDLDSERPHRCWTRS
jgi:hypothetical protein